MTMMHNDQGGGLPRARRGHRSWGRARGTVVALVLAVAGSGLTVTGTVAGAATPAEASGLPVVSTGGYHTCALMPDQSAWCWGRNTTGQLGNGTRTDSLVPVKVTGLPPAAGVAAGQSHTCAVDTSNRVWCWGSNPNGELGNGTTGQDSPVPVQVTGGLQASQVSAGNAFSCAVTLAHTVDCWGYNHYGELGNGTTASSSKPVPVTGLTNVVQVATGWYHACARESNGSLWCWGRNASGQLGNNSTTNSSVPVIVSMQNVTQVAAGISNTCAIGNAPGDLYCWGYNGGGTVGDGTTTDRHMPTQVAGLSSGVQQVSVGFQSACAIAAIPSNAALCWGGNFHGNIGDGINRAFTPFPSQVFGLQSSPSGGPGGIPRQVAAGRYHACVVLSTAVLRCWGYGFYGQLGNGSGLDKFIPAPVIGLPGPPGSVSAVAGGDTTGCALTTALNVACWGWAAGDNTPLMTVHTSATPVQNLPPASVSQVTASFGGCALVRTGGLATEVRCWGTNGFGELGDGTTTDRLVPVKVQGLPGRPEAVTTSGADACANMQGGGAYCWGLNDHGQLGNGTTTNSSLPVAVQGLPSKIQLVQIAAAHDHTCALLPSQVVFCWGSNNHGQLGDGTTTDRGTPVQVTGLTGVLAITVGYEFSCALIGGGSVECWGQNQYGQLGNGSTSDSSTPVSVAGLTGAVTLASGYDATCAALYSGPVHCWGNNAAGELGSGSIGGVSATPGPVTGGFASDGSISGAMGQDMCALNTSQQALCWGDNVFGELGDGTSGLATDSGTPVVVQGL